MATTTNKTGLEAMTVKQLKEVCDRKGITYKAKAKREELIESLNNTKSVAQTGQRQRGEY